ncbi:SDR family NAD(P)-dependent oxidoreductase [Paraburkholderia sp. CNPSo 3281]|uniref:SDR family NAD(P)-dependent oxidoreductase n=1 Tax=Paraburkholderia sp. CNPSo 3281 TaxID=2940933 RepID=UPI0020B8A756|nr:glucose 1-dehydrogenase [Paraburkholderia sp. CNPSo 3281]MCP3720433.1 SDR family oxidoreductase [Paraburkholderia sp. CNPSo 3281]
MNKLVGKVALITGAARGLGAEMARVFAQQGAAVLVADVLDGSEVVNEIIKNGGSAKYAKLDVTKEAEWKLAVQQAVDSFGKLDILVNNAGIVPKVAPIEERTVEEWDQVMAVNARGVFLGTKIAIPEMRKAGSGSIVNVSSIAALGQWTHMEAAYAASKGAVLIFTKTTAAQYARDGIRCNSIHPGPIDTPMLRATFPNDEAMSKRLSRIPLGRMGQTPEVVNAALYLASDDSSYTTGTELTVDGGASVL